MEQGVDYRVPVPKGTTTITPTMYIDPSSIEKAGFQFVIEYIGETNNYGYLRPTDVVALDRQQLPIVSVFEKGGMSDTDSAGLYTNAWVTYFSPGQGKADALDAINAARAAGQTSGAIYFAIDLDPANSTGSGISEAVALSKILEYFEEIDNYFKQVDAPYKIGVYGAGDTLAYLTNSENASLSGINFTWLADAWSSEVNAVQSENLEQTDTTGDTTIGGEKVNLDTARTPGFGQWSGSSSSTNPSPPVAPTPMAMFAGYGAAGSPQGLWATDGTAAGTYELTGIANAYPTGMEPSELTPSELTAFNGETLFIGLDASAYYGLWVTDGTVAGTSEIGGIGSSGINGMYSGGLLSPSLVVFNGEVLFSAHSLNGTQSGLWVTDGTAAGTQQLEDISGAYTGDGGPGPSDLTVFNGEVLFEQYGADRQFGLWVTNGTASGTQELTGITDAYITGIFGGGGFDPDLTVVDGEVLFAGLNATQDAVLWVTDGTTAGTHELSVPGLVGGPSDLTVFNGVALFDGTDQSRDVGLWVTNGTAEGTYELTGISGAASSGIFQSKSGNTIYGYAQPSMTVFNGEVLFAGFDASGEYGLWTTNGTAAGTHELTGITGANSSGIFSSSFAPDLTVFNGEILFNGLDASGNLGLWVTDGTVTDTHELGISGVSTGTYGLDPTDITAASSSSPPTPSDLALSPSDNANNDIIDGTTPIVTGDGEAGDTVILYDGITAVGSTTVAGNGSWAITTSPLVPAAHALVATETNASGGISPQSTSLSITVVSPSTPPTFAALGLTMNVVTTPDGSNLPPPLSGDFNLEEITSPSGTSYPIGSGYQGVALVRDGAVTLLHGNYGVVDPNSGGGDTIVGGDGNDLINALVGNDVIEAGSGNATVFGASGDVVENGSGAAFMTLSGGANPTIFALSAGTALLYAGADDTLVGGGATATVVGAPGDDFVLGAGNDTVNVIPTGETLTFGSGSGIVYGGPGDTIGDAAGTVITFTSGMSAIVLAGTGDSVLLYSGPGDTLVGGNAASTVIGSANDEIMLGAGADTVNAFPADEVVALGSGANETVYGGTGDTIEATGGAALVTFESGSQGIVFAETSGAIQLYSGPGDTLLIGAGTLNIIGSANNTLILGSGTDTVNAVPPDETVTFGTGNATVYGGDGDTIGDAAGTVVTFTGGNSAIAVEGTSGAVTVTNGAGDAIAAGNAAATIVGADNSAIVLGSAADTVTGSNGETITAGAGSDSIDFNTGVSHTAAEFLAPGSGADTGASDTVTNFSQATGDRILETGTAETNAIASANSSGGNTTITLSDGSTVTLVGVSTVNSGFFT